MMQSVRFWPEHVRELLARPGRPNESAMEYLTPASIEFALLAYTRQGHIATTIEIEGQIAASVGIAPLWQHVGELWTIIDPSLRSNARFGSALIWWGRRTLPEWMAAANLHRVQAVVDARDTNTVRALRLVGFAEEGVMRAYGPDRADHVRLAAVDIGRRH